MWLSARSAVVSFNTETMDAPNFSLTDEDENDIRSSGANSRTGMVDMSLREADYWPVTGSHIRDPVYEAIHQFLPGQSL